ncbi:hypothetical protein ACFL6S_02135 [Candidatus Poribacteria bacterium]
MLEIRKEQMEVFEQAAVKNFEDRVIEHLEESFPKRCSALGEARVRGIIRYGWEQAKGYGLISERGVCLYVTLIFALGSGFDADPQLPWAAEALKDDNIEDEVARIDEIYDSAEDYFDNVAGDDNEYLDEALRRAREESSYDISEPEVESLENRIAGMLNNLFPEKYEYIGEDCVNGLIQLGIESTKRYDITSERGVAIYIGLMFILGSGFDNDPQFPWAEMILNDEAITDQTERVDGIYAAAVSALEQWPA